MRKILITGATGNIGMEVVAHLYSLREGMIVTAGVRDLDKSKAKFASYPDIVLVEFDFENSVTFEEALEGVDCVFLLRPPHISNVKSVFYPLIESLEKLSVNQVVFLSVQGVEKSTVIPHHKIEKRIQQGALDYVFLRPGYFMQNLSTTLLADIRTHSSIILPAGKAVFNWIDVKDIGAVAARVILQFDAYKNTAIELTGTEKLDFYQVAAKMSHALGRSIQFQSVSILRFFIRRKKQGMKTGMVLVMIMLHYLPRFQKPPKISHACTTITGKTPGLLDEFLKRKRNLFSQKSTR
jgi:uncharacterized protein YbjT (DUF2867 family)